jgi:hypothetical protein
MIVPDDIQLQRLELKYIVSEAVALEVRDFLSCHLELDEFGAGRPRLSYPVHSLYLDSRNLTTYWNTINGNKNRYKLRMRFYEDAPGAPVFVEIKRRMNEAILKQRGGIRREFVEAFLAGQQADLDQIVSRDPKQISAVHGFHELMVRHSARPRAHVFYHREAWISTADNSLRVTLDRDVQCAPEFTTRFTGEMDDPVRVFGGKVVLELKFTTRFPNWLRELVRVFGLVQCSAAKYADGIALKGERFFSETSEEADPVSEARREARLAALNSLREGSSEVSISR